MQGDAHSEACGRSRVVASKPAASIAAGLGGHRCRNTISPTLPLLPHPQLRHEPDATAAAASIANPSTPSVTPPASARTTAPATATSSTIPPVAADLPIIAAIIAAIISTIIAAIISTIIAGTEPTDFSTSSEQQRFRRPWTWREGGSSGGSGGGGGGAIGRGPRGAHVASHAAANAADRNGDGSSSRALDRTPFDNAANSGYHLFGRAPERAVWSTTWVAFDRAPLAHVGAAVAAFVAPPSRGWRGRRRCFLLPMWTHLRGTTHAGGVLALPSPSPASWIRSRGGVGRASQRGRKCS